MPGLLLNRGIRPDPALVVPNGNGCKGAKLGRPRSKHRMTGRWQILTLESDNNRLSDMNDHDGWKSRASKGHGDRSASCAPRSADSSSGRPALGARLLSRLSP